MELVQYGRKRMKKNGVAKVITVVFVWPNTAFPLSSYNPQSPFETDFQSSELAKAFSYNTLPV